MAINLLESVRNFITPDLVDRASSHLGESRDGVQKAITGGIPAVLASFVNRAERGDSEGLLRDSREAASHNLAQTAGTMFAADRDERPVGTGLGNLFSGGLSSIPAALASFAGIKPGSANSLLSLLAPLGLGVIGKHAMDNNLDAGGLRSFLTGQKASIMNALPAGLNIGNLFGAAHAHDTDSVHRVSEHVRATAAARTPHMEPERRRAAAGATWPVWLLLGIGAIALLWYLMSRGDTDRNEVVTTTDTASVAPPVTSTTTTTAHAAKAPTKVRLANGTELDAYAGGVEEKLVNCLNDAACKAGSDQWFDFDNINFETGSARLTPESQAQVRNIVAVLNAYPAARIKIGGYTDKVGNAAANQRLSQQRAEAVLNAIKAAGGKASQLVGAEGYGAQFAKVPVEASDAERRADRRIAVQLREK